MRSILEKALVHLLNEEHEQAEALFHKYMVERARQIHESLRQGEDAVLDDNWEEEMTSEEYFTEADLDDAEDDTMDGDDLDLEADDLDADEEEAEDAADELEADLGDDVEGDDLVDDEADGEVDERIADLEDQLERLTAEFEDMMAKIDAEGGEETDPEDADLDDADFDDVELDDDQDEADLDDADLEDADPEDADLDDVDMADAMEDDMEDDVKEAFMADDDAEKRKAFSEANILLDSPRYTILSPKTKFAAMFFGRDTEWSTAWGDPSGRHPTRKCRFDDFHKGGPLYVIIDKKSGHKWQFHFETGLLMDENDRRINVQEFINSHPEMAKFFHDREVQDTEIDEDFEDITESVMAELEKVSVKLEDGKEIAAGKGIDTNKTSPIPQKPVNTRQGGKPVQVKSDTHKGFDRETAPEVKPMKKRQNTKAKAAEFTEPVKKTSK